MLVSLFHSRFVFRSLLWLLLVPLSLAVCGSAFAATYYVRTDGGTSQQCTGLSNAAYSGTGTAQACAWKHPFVALPPFKAPRIAGGDTLIIGRGSYMMGIGAPDTDACNATASYDCVTPKLPSGLSATQPTRILGEGFDASCPTPPELWGNERAFAIFQLTGASNIEIGCLDLTDHSSCIKNHNHFGGTPRGETARCQSDAAPYGPWGEYGIVAEGAGKTWLHDLNIHGFAVNGIRAGRLTDWTIERVKIRANGWAGWDGDIAPGNQTLSSNSGNIIFRDGEIAWNGCGERYPSKEVFGCWAQGQGGYGDGLGTGRTGGNWLFEDMRIHHNTSDGLDLLYMNGTGSVTVRRMRAEGNAGNQIKVAGTSLVENSVAISNCAFFDTFPTSNLTEGEDCRAMGNTLSINLIDNSVATVRNNTITGQGDCQIITVGGTTSAKVLVQNNAIVGDTEWRSHYFGYDELSCGHYAESSVAPVVFENNLFWNVKGDQCPPGSICGKDPKLTRAVYENYDATPLAGSPLIDAGKTISGMSNDYFKRPRPVGSAFDIGAIEVQSGSTSPPPSDTTAPTAIASVSGSSGTIVLSANASDNVGVAKVEFLIDGALRGSALSSPFTLSLNSSTLSNGSHSLVAKAYDAAGNVGTSTAVSFSVNNTSTPPPTDPTDTTAPTVSASLTGNSGTITLSATASDNVGVARVDFMIDGVLAGSDASSPYSLSFDSTTLSNGTRYLMAFAYDAAGNSANSTAVSFSINNTTTATPLAGTDQYLWMVPPGANTQQQGFVRLMNRESRSGQVTFWGLDATGKRSSGTVTLTLAANESRQFTSAEMESGSLAKGLTGSLGKGNGNWTLVVRSDLDMEALAYIRTSDGFLTSMHDRVVGDGVDWFVPMFNPAENPNQVSRLRMINTNLTPVSVQISATDDAGKSGLNTVMLTLPALTSSDISSADLENGNAAKGLIGKLGDGSGKWQLTVAATGRLTVQSLLFDPIGKLTNLSTLSDAAEPAPGQRVLWMVPSAANIQQQGFIRLINRENRSSQVALWGIDDAGRKSSGTITLTMKAKESRQLTSQDLEYGNTAKGLTGKLGSGVGNWRLVAMTDLDLVPMSLIRTTDGFLTSVHDLVTGDGLNIRVPIFNPADNPNQVSVLRLVNPNSTAASVTIRGTDDTGSAGPGGTVSLTLAAGAAVELSAADLENGNLAKALKGKLGNGSGKWTLNIAATTSVKAMSLLRDPKGYLTNLSNGAKGGSGKLDP